MSVYGSLLINMYYSGSISRKDHNAVEFITKDNDYKIIFTREELSIPWSSDNAQYKCRMLFKNNLGRDILHLDFSEIDAMIMLDNMNEFIQETRIFDEFILSGIKCSENIYKSYNMSLHTIWNNSYVTEPKYIFKIEEFDSQYQVLTPKISIEFNDDSLGNLMDLIFFCYLIDIYELMI